MMRLTCDCTALASAAVAETTDSAAVARLRAAGMRADVDTRSERMNAKIRDAQNQKIPYMLVIGDKELEAGAVALRMRSGENPGAMPLNEFIAFAQQQIAEKI